MGSDFKKSSFCGGCKSCVEVSLQDKKVVLRNSNKNQEHISYTLDEWKAFISGVKNSEFDI